MGHDYSHRCDVSCANTIPFSLTMAPYEPPNQYKDDQSWCCCSNYRENSHVCSGCCLYANEFDECMSSCLQAFQ